MVRKSQFLVVALLLAVQVHAASIWQVKGEQTFYLFGTIHLLKPDNFPLPSVYGQTLPQCDALWLEIDNNELKNRTTLQMVQSYMQLPAGKTLRNTLTASQYRQLQMIADAVQIDLAPLQQYKLWVVVNELTTAVFKQRGFSDLGLDVYLHQYADTHDLPVNALETFMFQMQLFDTLQQQSVDDYLAFSADDLDNADAWIADMIRSWQQGDVQSLYEASGFDQYPAIEDAMLTERNKTWMDTLLSLPKGDTHCVAVGLLHMAGKHGLLAQFEAAGYQVTQLP